MIKAKHSVVLHHTYVLFSLKDHKLYIGFTTNLEKRVEAHNQGLNKSTRPRRPLKLIYFEGHTQKADALRIEASSAEVREAFVHWTKVYTHSVGRAAVSFLQQKLIAL